MDNHAIAVEHWPTFQLPKNEVKATLQYLAHKTQKPVSFAQYDADEGYTPGAVSVRVMVHDGVQATYALRQVTLNGQTYALSSQQKATGLALVQNDWKKIADEEAQLIGCVDHNRIIIPIDITATDNEAARAILGYVVEKAIPLLDFDLDHILKDKEDEFERHFISTFQQGVRARLQNRQEEFDQRKRDAEQAYYTVLDFERERIALEEEIKHLTSLAEKQQSHTARSQAKALMQIQHSGMFSQVRLNDEGVLMAMSSPITIEHDGYAFPVGRYEVEIPANGDVRIRGLDEHPNAEHPHPHVARDGRPCLGNISGDVAKLIGKMRYAETLQLLHTFLSSYNPENPYEKIGHFDPEGQYQEDEPDPCEDCDDKCTPHCIFSCDDNNGFYTCSDCCDLRSEYCYQECEHNRDFEQFHPCDDCSRKGTEHCYDACRYNEEWQLQNPCDDCSEECTDACPHHQRKESMEHAN